jgi:hypothetical protein
MRQVVGVAFGTAEEKAAAMAGGKAFRAVQASLLAAVFAKEIDVREQFRLIGAFPDVRPRRKVSYGSRIVSMPRGNPSPKLAITIDPEVHESVLAAAARDGVSVSAWMTMAAREALQRRTGLAAVALWERQHGLFSAEEINEARRNVRAQLRRSRTVRRTA